MGISVVLLAYREAGNLKLLLPQIQRNLDQTGTDYEILVIDSKEILDETPLVCEAFGVRRIPQEEDHYGGAFRTGIKYASKERTLVLDCDGSHSPDAIGGIYDKSLEGADLVIGSRYCRGGHTEDAPVSIVMSKILNTVMRAVIGVRARDISTSFRMYRTQQLKAVALTCENYDVLQEVVLRLKLNKKGFRICEVPIDFKKRVYGESKRKLLKFIGAYAVTLFGLLAIRIKTRPAG